MKVREVEQTKTGSKVSRWWAIVVGIGIALSPIHNQWLTNLATNSAGETMFFLPAFGYLIWIMGTGLFLLHHWDRVKEIGWGDRRVVGCLLFIVLAISASGAAYSSLQDRFAPMGMGMFLFGLYLMARVVGKDLFLPLAVGACIASLGVIAHQVIFPGQITGGFVFERNYDIVVGYVLLGTTLWISPRHQWWLASLALIAMLFTGSPEAIFTIFIVGVIVLLRKDWGKRLVWTTVALVGIVVIFFGYGYGQQTYDYFVRILRSEVATANVSQTELVTVERHAIGYRVHVIYDSMTSIQPLGTGYSVTDFNDRILPSGRVSRIVHNVPLVIVQQLGWPGILAGLAWLWVSVWCLVKTRWKYAWVIILALSVWDHFIWTQLNFLWPVIVGVSTAPDNIKSDLLFKEIGK